MLKTILKNIPDELKALEQWVNWDKKKLPKNSRTGGNAMPTNKSTWSTFDKATEALKKKVNMGVGFNLTNYDEYVVIDIDHCIEDDRINPIAEFWIEQFDSYTEISPSGTGIHIFVKGDVSSLVGNGKKTLTKHSASGMGFEIYHTARYFTVTGVPYYDDGCGAIDTKQNILELFFYTYFKKGRKKTIWRPIDGPITEGDRNVLMQQIAGSISSKVVQLIDDSDEQMHALTEILHHYNEEYFNPPLKDKELEAQLRSAEKYLDKNIEEYSDAIKHDDEESESEAIDTSENEHDEKPAIKQVVENYVYIAEQHKFFDRKNSTMIKPEAVNHYHADKRFMMRVAGEMKPVTLTKFMTASKNRKKASGITWVPEGPEFISNEGEILYNSYKEICTKHLPKNASNKSVKRWLDLVSHIIEDENDRNSFFDFFAQTLQNPGQKINYGILICSEYEGVGKDLSLMPIVKYMSSQAREISTSQLLAPFNSHLARTKLLVVHEIHTPKFQDKRAMESTLKPLLAAPPYELDINNKNQMPYGIKNVVSVVMTTNHDDAIAITDADKSRRYLAIKSLATPKPPSFYKEYIKWGEGTGFDSIIRWLLDRDITNIDFSRSPGVNKEFLKSMEKSGMSQLYHRVSEALESPDISSMELFGSGDIKNALDDEKISEHSIIRELNKMRELVYFGKITNHLEFGLIKRKNYIEDKKAKTLKLFINDGVNDKRIIELIDMSGSELLKHYNNRKKNVIKSVSVVNTKKDKFTK